MATSPTEQRGQELQLIWASFCQAAAVDRGRWAAGGWWLGSGAGRVVGRVAFSLMMRAWPWLLKTLVSLAGVRCLGTGVAREGLPIVVSRVPAGLGPGAGGRA
jgi:hypothetical protein